MAITAWVALLFSKHLNDRSEFARPQSLTQTALLRIVATSNKDANQAINT